MAPNVVGNVDGGKATPSNDAHSLSGHPRWHSSLVRLSAATRHTPGKAALSML